MGNQQPSKNAEVESVESVESVVSIGTAYQPVNDATNNKTNMILIGRNYHNEMPLELQLPPNIAFITSGKGYTIYYNHDTQQYYVAGNNRFGQCGIQRVTNIHHYSLQNTLSNNAICDNLQFTKINYFTQNNMKITEVFSNIVSLRTFWITDENKIYFNGNKSGFYYNQYFPIYIAELYHIVDIKSNCTQSIILCRMEMDIIIHIIDYFANNNVNINKKPINIPNDIFTLIIKFCGLYNVYLLKYNKSDDCFKIEKLMKLSTKEIIQIDCTMNGLLLLESNGTVWYSNATQLPQFRSISYFIRNNIKIIKISCGYNHNLAIDDNHRVYSWGNNNYCQLGYIYDGYVYVPKLIDKLKTYKIINIQCGLYHSYAMSEDGKHFLWGSNRNNECIVTTNLWLRNGNQIEPYCINNDIELMTLMLTEAKIIKHVSLGMQNTKIILK